MAKRAARGAPQPQAKKAPLEPTVDNRRARFEYEFLERWEAGVVLTGTEIKSIRSGGVSLNEAFARVRDGELWLVGMYVPPYKEGSWNNHEPRRARKLLMHRGDIDRLAGLAAEKGLTIVPTRLYFKRGMVKVEIGLARGKKLWDKRRTIKEREASREMARAARSRGSASVSRAMTDTGIVPCESRSSWNACKLNALPLRARILARRSSSGVVRGDRELQEVPRDAFVAGVGPPPCAAVYCGGKAGREHSQGEEPRKVGASCKQRRAPRRRGFARERLGR